MKIRNPFANWLIARIGTWFLRALFLTVRVEHHKVATDGTPYRRATGPTRFCFCMWHDAIVTAVVCAGGHRSRWQSILYDRLFSGNSTNIC